METFKAFFAEYGYSFCVMIITGFVIAIVLEITVKKALSWLEGKLIGHEKLLAALQVIKAFGIQLVTWVMVVCFLNLIVENLPLPAGKYLYPIWLGLEYIIQYVFSCFGIKGVQEWLKKRAEKTIEKEDKPAKTLSKVEGVSGLYKDENGVYYNKKGEVIEV